MSRVTVPVQADMSQLTCPGCPATVLSSPSCPSFPFQVVLTQLVSPCCHVLAIVTSLPCRLTCSGWSGQADLFCLSCPCCPIVLAPMAYLSSYCCPVPAVLSYHVLAILSKLICQSRMTGSTVLSQMSCPSCTVMVALSCPRCPVPTVVLPQLSCHGCPATIVLSGFFCLSCPV
jgi:hypothetical protein